MVKYPNTSAPIPTFSLFRPRQSPSVKQGSVSVVAELRHFSLIVYQIPSERARALTPGSLAIEETVQDGRKTSWISVVSFLDQGSRRDGYGAFEQTSYRLHVVRDGKPSHFLLGISLGSLSAAATRNLWPAPWHLSAMEFQVAYDMNEGRYREYRLQTQSQWSTAGWEISDTGESLLTDRIENLSLPSSISANVVNNYFTRRDGELGLYETRYQGRAFTAGILKNAQSDLLQRLGLLSGDEFMRPTLVAIQRSVSCQIFSPTIVGDHRIIAPKSESISLSI